jgi:hypothetical protein
MHLNLASRTWLATILNKVTREQTLRMILEKRRPRQRVMEVQKNNLSYSFHLSMLCASLTKEKHFVGSCKPATRSNVLLDTVGIR